MSLSLPTPPRVPGLVLGTSPYALGDVAWRSPGATNLLTSNQANGSESGTVSHYVYLATSGVSSTAQAAQGTRSVLVTGTNGAYSGINTQTSSSGLTATPVVAGRVYTAVVSVYLGGGSSTLQQRVLWYKADGTSSATAATTSNPAAATSAWVERRMTVTAPSDAAYAAVDVVYNGAAATGDSFYTDKWGLWEGPGGTWALPGEPIQGIGTWVDESVGRRVHVWNPLANSGSGGWQMVYGDTGWRDITASLSAISGVTPAYAYIRRQGNVVTFHVRVSSTGAFSSSALYTVPTGFRFRPDVADLIYTNFDSAGVRGWVSTTAGGYTFQLAGAGALTAINHLVMYPSSDAWPSSLPGVASGSIPYN